jgi:hypothetical protein
LYRAAEMEAYPALISTYSYPDMEMLHPWPSFFDHTMVVVRVSGDEYILDPSDPLSGINHIPLRLRGRDYLVADGVSGLETVPYGPEPSEGFSSIFIARRDSSGIGTDFNIKYLNDSAVRYGINYAGFNDYQEEDAVSAVLKEGGWNVDVINIETRRTAPDTFSVAGEFHAEYSAADSLSGFPVGSPLLSYLIDNIFDNVRKASYCPEKSIRLEELVRLQNMEINSRDFSEYRDYWIREGLEFYDEMKYIGDDIIFRRVFDLDGREISGEDYNAFRNFLLSRKNQRYVYLGE